MILQSPAPSAAPDRPVHLSVRGVGKSYGAFQALSAIDLDVPEALAVSCEGQDLDEMLGNLVDNACRWCRARVRVSATTRDGAVAVVLARGSILKAITMILVGILLSTIGPDITTGQGRMTFGFDWLSAGLAVAILGMGLFGLAEVFRHLEPSEARQVAPGAIGRLLPGREELRQSAKPILRGTLVGAILGILPGNGAVLGPYASYAIEKKLAHEKAAASEVGEGSGRADTVSPVVVVLAWAAVGIPLAWGVYKTLINVGKFFN